MSHNVETMAYTNEVPWHGLGTYIAKAPNVDAMIKLAGLDWQVERRPIQFGDWTKNRKGEKVAVFNGKSTEVNEFAALVRDKDNELLDVVGSKYVPTQNKQAFEFFNEFVEAGDATMETAGSLRNGRWVWGLAKLKHDFDLPGKDKVKGYLLVACPHQQGKSLLMKSTAVRVVCNNTLTLALSKNEGGEFRMVHRQEFDTEMIKKAKETLGLAREQIDVFKENATKLKKTRMNDQDVLDVLCPVYEDETFKVSEIEEKASRTLKQILDCYRNAPGADPGTGWGVLNAVTYHADHLASRTPDKRLTNAWFGRTGREKQKVLDLLLA